MCKLNKDNIKNFNKRGDKLAYTNLIFFVLSCIILVLSGSWCVRSLAKLTKALRLNEFSVGFIIMAVSTSIPELFVGITSAFEGTPLLSVGNLIGANIIGLTLISGIIILLRRGIKIKSKTIRKDALYMFFITLIPLALFVFDRKLSRLDGIILIIIFSLYILKLLKQEKEFKSHIKDGFRINILFLLLTFIASLVLLFISSELAVRFGTSLSIELALPVIFIGLFFVSVGTTLPELIFESSAVLKGHPEMALGTIIGSVVANITLILGIVALISPITGNFIILLSSAIFMIIVSFLFATFVESGSKLSWKEGVSLIMLYTFFVIIEFYIKIVSNSGV